MQSTIFNNNDNDLYFLDFLELSQIKLYIVLSKSTSIIFKKSVYYKEYILLKSKSNYLNFDNICNEGCLNLLKAYTKNFHKTEYTKYKVIGADISEKKIMMQLSENLEVVKYLASIVENINNIINWVTIYDVVK